MNNKEFLQKLANEKFTVIDIVKALIWFENKEEKNILTLKRICEIIELTGYPKLNSTRVKINLIKDKQISSQNKGTAFTLNLKYKKKLDKLLIPYLDCVPIVATESILPLSFFKESRKYILKVVEQINASYDHSLFDCCAVMCRRLLETLIIEVYESMNKIDNIKDQDGEFFSFAGLIKVIKKDKDLNLTRNAKTGFDSLKRTGDLSAHSRKYNAKKSDIDNIKNDLRLIVEELINSIN